MILTTGPTAGLSCARSHARFCQLRTTEDSTPNAPLGDASTPRVFVTCRLSKTLTDGGPKLTAVSLAHSPEPSNTKTLNSRRRSVGPAVQKAGDRK